MLQYFKKELVE
jgi:hypothetical protein